MYGLGAFVVPLVATQFARRTAEMEGRWNYHYLVSLGVALVNTAGLVWVFRGKREEVLFQEQGFTPVGGEGEEKIEIDAGHLDSDHADGNHNQEDDNDLTAVDEPSSAPGLGSHVKFKRILSSPFIHLVAAFSLLYVGIEVTIGGWAVTFIVEARGGGDDSGYVSSGFFGGLMVGRIVQIGVGRFVSEHRIVYVYTGIALALEIVSFIVALLLILPLLLDVVSSAMALGRLRAVFVDEPRLWHFPAGDLADHRDHRERGLLRIHRSCLGSHVS
jgi:hypothetical protein